MNILRPNYIKIYYLSFSYFLTICVSFVFRNVFELQLQIKTELECLVKLLDGKISKDEEVAIEELHQYLIEDEGSWALGDNFLVFVQRVLREQTFSPDTRIHMIRTLAFAALKDDVIIILHQDRRDHTLMNFGFDIEKHTPEEQQAWALFVRFRE